MGVKQNNTKTASKDDDSKFSVKAAMQRERIIGMLSICWIVRCFTPDWFVMPGFMPADFRLLGSV
jgi:hypothetical protein